MRIRPATLRLCWMLAATTCCGLAAAQDARLMSAASVTERADHLDLAIEFNCRLTYLGHTPADQGDQVLVRLGIGNDCGLATGAAFPAQFLLPADGRGLVRSLSLQPGLAGGAELRVEWNRIEQFLLVPTSGQRGLRIRVQRRSGAQVLIDEPLEPTADYAVNLDSATTPFDDLAVARASSLLQVPVYVSEVDVEGTHWYRLRAGPFATRREAGEILRLAQSRYPSAWMGISDEPVTTPADAAALPGARGAAPPEQRADATLDAQLDAARVALNARDHDAAIASLTQIVAVQDYARRSEAAELLGLARERRGQLAQAKAVYEDYLRRYPDSPATRRVRERLEALRLADLPGRAGTRAGEGQRGWMAWGYASQLYRHDDARLSAAGLSRDVVTQHAILTDADGLLRHRGDRYDFTARSSFGYMKDLQSAGREDRLRVSSFYAELGDRSRSLNARLGRQSRGMSGINGTFDGVLGYWQARPRLGASLAFGAPVENTRSGPDFDRWFVGTAVDFVGPGQSWEASAFALAQQFGGQVDRRSIGMEVRYLKPGRTLLAMSDYDLHFGEFNAMTLLGTLVTDARWTFNVNAGWQRSPSLSLRNALIGQPTLLFDELADSFTGAEIEQLALDRSARLTQLTAAASHPLGDSGQWTMSLASFDLSGTPASGGVAAVPPPGRETSLSSEFLKNGLLRTGDTHSFVLRAQRGGAGNVYSAGIGSRLPLGNSLRLTSRLRVDRRDIASDGSRLWTWVPSLRLEYQRGGGAFELEAGMELGRRGGGVADERNDRRYLSAGYRWTLDRRDP